MKITQSLMTVGEWEASQKIRGIWVIGLATNKLEAMDRVFRKLEWGEVGNWNKNDKNLA